MKKRILNFITYFISIVFYFSAEAQMPSPAVMATLDDFSDGNFNANPVWNPVSPSGNWTVSGGVLRLNELNGSFALSTPFAKACDAWQFDYVMDGGFAGQTLDYFFFMTNASNNPRTASGYRVRYQLGNTSNVVSLQRVTNGVVSNTIVSFNNGLTNGLPKITVTRKFNNEWEFFVGSVSRGKGIDATYSISEAAYQGLFGFLSSNNSVPYNHGFDNIRYREVSFGTFATAPFLTTCVENGFFSTTGEGIDRISNINFNDTSFGTYIRNSGGLILRGAEIKTFKNPAVSNVCTPVLNYRIFSEGSTPGKFDTMHIPFNSDCFADFFPTGGPCTTGQQKWQTINQNIDLTVYPPGNYTLQLFYKIPGGISSTNSCSDTLLVDNGGSYYSASFSIIEPSVTSANPTSCNSQNGFLTIRGLVANTPYSLTYRKENNIEPIQVNQTTDTRGEILISGLDAGIYNSFFLSNECGIDINGAVTLTNPSLNINTVSSPNTLCNTFFGGGGACVSKGTGVIINEVMAQPRDEQGCPLNSLGSPTCQGITQREYVELYNPTCDAIDISCYMLSAAGGLNSGFTIVIPAGTIINPKSHYVIGSSRGSSDVKNIDFKVDLNLAYLCAISNTGPLMINGDGWLSLYDREGKVIDAIFWTFSDNQFEKITNNDDDLNYRSCSPPVVPGCASSGVILKSATEIYIASPALIQYVGRSNIQISGSFASPTGKTFSRIPDGGAWQRDIDPSIDGSNCNGGICDLNTPIIPDNCNGTANVTISVNVSDYSFEWKDASGNLVGYTQTINNLCAGTYTVTVTDKVAGCIGETTVTVTDNIPLVTPEFNNNLFSPVCQGDVLTTVTLPVTSNNGITGTWNPASLSSDVFGDIEYKFTPDAGQCADPVTFTQRVNPRVTPTFNFTLSSTICSGDPTIPNNLPGISNNNIIGSWSPTPISSTQSDVYTFTPLSNACANKAILTVTVIQRPNVIVRPDTSLFHNSVYPGDIFGGLPTGSVVGWTNSNSSIGLPASGSGNIPAFTAINIGSTGITSTITVNASNGNCAGSARSFMITVLPAVITSSGNESVLQSFIKIYPNPARDVLQINYGAATASRGEIRLLDMQGRIVYSRSVGIAAGENRYDIQLNNIGISAGSYLLKLQSGNAEQQVKVVVVR